MSRHLWSVLCQSVITDRETNSVSYINSIEEITAVQLPVRLPLVFVGTLWQKDDKGSDLEVRVRILAPDGRDIRETTFGPQPFRQLRWRLNFGFEGAQLEGVGEYSFVIEHKIAKEWSEATRLPLAVKLQTQAKSAHGEVAAAAQR